MVKRYKITSESVTEGHPDKICDQISDAILDELLKQDPNSRVAVETLITNGSVHVAGEVTTIGFVDVQKVVRDTLRDIGYIDPKFGIGADTAGVWVAIHEQSPDIAQGVLEGKGEYKEQGAGDQGCLGEGTLVRTNKGYVPIEKIVKGDMVSTPYGLKKVLDSRKTGFRPVIELELLNGMRISCTSDHKIFCYNKDGNNYWKEAGELSEEDYICLLKYSNDFSEKIISSTVKKESFFTKYNHKIYGPEKITLDENLGYLSGLLIGDGCLTNRRHIEVCFGKEKKFALKIKDILENYFPNQCKINETSDGIISLKINSVLIRKHFENFGFLYHKSPKKITPNKIFISPKKVINAYLRGLFDSDGTIVESTGRSKENIKIRLSSSSLKLLEETQLLLSDLKIKSNICFNVPKGTKVGKAPQYCSNFDNYTLNVLGFESYQNFGREVGFSHPIKNKRINNYLKNNTSKKNNSRGIFLIPHPNKKEMIDEDKLGINLPFTMTHIKQKNKKTNCNVYDLEVEEVNMFSGNGIFVHNSMYGYACNETRELMPLPIMLAHKLAKKLAEVRKYSKIKGLGPDGKSQVTIEYEDDKPKRIDTIVIAQQHEEDVQIDGLRKDILKYVIIPICGDLIDEETNIHINATGRFVIGGPEGDTGLTGRKIIVDTYGGVGRHGGGAFSGKSACKVDRSGAYMARYIAKNIVAAGLATKCEVQISYAIGVSKPTSIYIECFGTNKISEEDISQLVYENFDMTPKGIIKILDLKRPIYKKTSVYGHFGRDDEDFTWEKTDKADVLRPEVNLK